VHRFSLKSPPLHQEVKINSSHASADDNENHDDNDDEDCMNQGLEGTKCRRF
jgi:hypothetical protein